MVVLASLAALMAGTAVATRKGQLSKGELMRRMERLERHEKAHENEDPLATYDDPTSEFSIRTRNAIRNAVRFSFSEIRRARALKQSWREDQERFIADTGIVDVRVSPEEAARKRSKNRASDNYLAQRAKLFLQEAHLRRASLSTPNEGAAAPETPTPAPKEDEASPMPEESSPMESKRRRAAQEPKRAPLQPTPKSEPWKAYKKAMWSASYSSSDRRSYFKYFIVLMLLGGFSGGMFSQVRKRYPQLTRKGALGAILPTFKKRLE